MNFPFLLQDWCSHHGAECLAVQLPGRGMRVKEPFLPSMQELARQLLPVVASLLQDTPYIVCYAVQDCLICQMRQPPAQHKHVSCIARS